MKIPPRKRSKIFRLPKNTQALFVSGCPRAIIVDSKFATKLREIKWRYDPKKNRLRGYFSGERQFIHRYVLTLAGKHYPEVTFSNGDWNDCRLVNLRPYDREEDGACRRPFKGRLRKGVSWHKRRKKWISVIRTRGKLKTLGYFTSADRAAAAYAKAWNSAHPNRKPVPVQKV